MTDLNLDGLTDAQLRLFAVRCARRVQYLVTDLRSLAALDVAARYAKGEATDEELAVAKEAARVAVEAALLAAMSSSWMAASWAARAAFEATAGVARNAARDASISAALVSRRGKVRMAERVAQRKMLAQMRKEDTP